MSLSAIKNAVRMLRIKVPDMRMYVESTTAMCTGNETQINSVRHCGTLSDTVELVFMCHQCGFVPPYTEKQGL